MTAEKHDDDDFSFSNDYDYDEIIRSGRELLDNVYKKFLTNPETPVVTNTAAQERRAGQRNIMQTINGDVKRIDRLVASLCDETQSISDESLPDISIEVVDLVNNVETRRNRRRPRRDVISFVDLCTPPSTSSVSHSSDVEITGIRQLRQRLSTNRRRKFPQTSNNNDDLNEEAPLSSAESSPKLTRCSVSTADDAMSPNAGDSYKCPICLENVKSRCPTSTKCGHIFCHECITKVLKVKPKLRKCPLCTKKVGLRDLVRLYF